MTEPYTAALLSYQPVGKGDKCFQLDKEVPYDKRLRSLKLRIPARGDLNHRVSAAMRGMTTDLRFRPAQLRLTQHRGSLRLVSRLCSVMTGFVPLTSRGPQQCHARAVPMLARQTFDARTRDPPLSRGTAVTRRRLYSSTTSYTAFE